MDSKNYKEQMSRIENNITQSIIDKNDGDLYITEPLGKFLFKEIISWVIIFVFAFVISIGINKYIIESTEVVGESMLPTLVPGEKLLINKMAYTFSNPKRGDVCVFLPDSEGKNYVKRIIALPGETIDIKDGKVYIDGTMLDESLYLDNEVITNKLYNSKDFPYTLGAEEYFAMGDNRSNSFDSRASDIGAVTKERMRGKALVRIYPFEKLKFFTRIKYNN